MEHDKLSRRTFIHNASLLAAGTIAGSVARKGYAGMASNVEKIVKNDRVNQSVSRWCYNRIPLDEFCAVVKKMGLKGIDLMGPKDFPTLNKHGLICTMIETHSLTNGINNKQNHDQCLDQIRPAIAAAADK